MPDLARVVIGCWFISVLLVLELQDLELQLEYYLLDCLLEPQALVLLGEALEPYKEGLEQSAQ